MTQYANMKFEVAPELSELAAWTYKEGLLSAFGHNLKVAAEKWCCDVTPNASLTEVKIFVDVLAESLHCLGQVLEDEEGTKSVYQLDWWSVGQINKNMRGYYVLDVAHYPQVTYRGVIKRSNPTAPLDVTNNCTIEGELMLHGQTKPLNIPCKFSIETVNGKPQVRLFGEIKITPSIWGIAPFSAMLGALKLKDQVNVSFNVVSILKEQS